MLPLPVDIEDLIPLDLVQ